MNHSIDPLDQFLAEVRAEVSRARSKFPGDRVMTLALAEEAGELVKAVLDEPRERVRREAVQCAAMAARVVLDGDGSVAAWREAKGLDVLAPESRAAQARSACTDRKSVRPEPDPGLPIEPLPPAPPRADWPW